MADPSGQTAGLRRGLEIWRRRRWLAILGFAGVLVPALCLAAFLPDLYRASATVVVEGTPVPDSLVPPSVLTGEVETRLKMISEEVLSRGRMNVLIDRFGLYPRLRGRVSPEGLAQRMRRDVDLELRGARESWGRSATIAFTLGYRGRDPGTVAEVANALATFYVEENLRMREREAGRTAEFLKSEMETMKQKLMEQEARISDFKTRHAGELPQQVEVNLAALERLNSQLQLNSERQLRALERRDGLLKGMGGAGDPVEDGVPADPAVRLARLRQELADLRTRYGPRYPDVTRLEAEITTLERRLEQPAAPGEGLPAGGSRAAAADGVPPPEGHALGRIDAELAALREEEKRLRGGLAAYEQRVESAPQRQHEFQALSRDYETTRGLYDSLLKRYEEALLAASMEHGHTAEQFRILDPAVPPREPDGPNRLWLAGVGLLLSLGMAAGLLALAEQLDTSFHSVEELRGFTTVPVLASIPRIVTRRDTRRRLARAGAAALAAALALILIAGATRYAAREYEPLVWILSGGRL
jgi:polysaccharide chain length determinant protein (PEP-CTERM system associated)